ncbi:MAG: proton-conducting transporter membrane subunit [Candidatus Omnitrophota bacterium]
MERILTRAWQVPGGELSLKLDPLSSLFLIAIAILSVCAGIYSVGYLRPYWGKKPLGLHVFFYIMLVMVLFLIVSANNAILFLGAWEGMTIVTYLLIIFNDEKPVVRKAGFIYFIASHCATFFLFLMFFLMAHISGSMNFDVMFRTAFSPFLAGMIFLLALAGFGVKAGFVPVHIWLPHAHPASPSHISAVMSGVVIKMGIYGICRVLWIVGVLPHWCGYLLLVIGVVSGVLGVLYALGQHELKKLLAYHSIENIGIIALGLGVGMLGRSYGIPLLAVLGFGGALLHVVNHSLFKGLLFLGAGSVIQKTHTGEMDRMGGLTRSMPLTSALFLIGALSICGLPLFNGFISEFIIYFGLFQGVFGLALPGVIFCSLGIISLALMGALALACFCKVYGVVFSGEARESVKGKTSPCLQNAGAPVVRGSVAEDTSCWMLLPMIVLAGLCVWIGLSPQTMARLTFLGGAYLAYTDISSIDLQAVFVPLDMVISSAFIFLALILVFFSIRRLLLGPRPMPVRSTWSCGFSQVTPRFQYTSSSFARSIIDLVRLVLMFRRHGGQATGLFPGKTHMSSSVHDFFEERIFRPGLAILTGLSKKVNNAGIRYTQLYLIYIFLFLIFLLAWKLK